MRLDGYDRTFPTHEVASKGIVQRNNHTKTDVLKVDIDSVSEGKEGIASPIESKSCEQTNMFQDDNSHRLHSYADIEDSIRADLNEGEHREAPYSIPTGKNGLVEKEMVVYTEKTVTVFEQPEPIACSTDGTCHTIKDICIDEGVHSLETVLVEGNEGPEVSYRFNQTVSKGDYDMIKGTPDDTEAMTDDACSDSHGLKSSTANEHVDHDDTEQCSFGSLPTGGGKLNKVTLAVEMSSEKLLLPLPVFDTDPWHVDLSSFDCINDQNQSIEHQKIGQGTVQERNSTATAVPSTSKESNQSNGSNGSPPNGAVESGVITFKFDSSAVTVSGREESKEKTDNQQSGEARYVLKAEEADHDAATASARSSFVQHGFGDSSLFGPSYLSGPMVSSGHIPYSGSISLRSDSSTTSARSFAFPILQSEWNSSPVKMAKADRRRFGKHRGWRMGLLCCRF